MSDVIHIPPEDIEIVDISDYSTDIEAQFKELPAIANPLVSGAKKAYKKVEKLLYSAPALINAVKAAVPNEMLQAVLTDEQKEQIAKGALKLMTKKDGSLLACLVDPKTKKIVTNVPLKSVKLSPELTKAVADYSSQMQMAQIAEQIQQVQIAIEEVRQGQENDRLALAYSCQQKLLQAMAIKNPELRTQMLLRIAADAEDCRNILMLSQSANVEFIKNQPESFWGKLISGASTEKTDARMTEIRDSLAALNITSLSEVMAYQELGEPEAAKQSLEYYADYIHKTYLSDNGLVSRLDLIDPSPKNYWSQTLPDLEKRIKALPCSTTQKKIGEKKNGRKNMQK